MLKLRISRHTTQSNTLEFMLMMTALMGVVGLALDGILPALDTIGTFLQVSRASDVQLLISLFFLGLGIGPLVWGPLSDYWGRKPIIYFGIGFFILGSVICISAKSLHIMILGRVIQGIGVSSPRTISIAMIRDRYSGDTMARMMSFVTSIFIFVPMIAPASGTYLIMLYNWQAIFYFHIIFCSILLCWFWKRQQETLNYQNRKTLGYRQMIESVGEILFQKKAMGYTLISGGITGAYLAYLSTAQQIFEQQYQLPHAFPYLFAMLSLPLGIATFLNGKWVTTYGAQKIVGISLLFLFGVSLCYILCFDQTSNPTIYVVLPFFGLQFFALGFLFGNLRALIMEPLGHIAGMTAAITGGITTLIAVGISIFCGRYVETSVFPLFLGFCCCAALAFLMFITIRVRSK